MQFITKSPFLQKEGGLYLFGKAIWPHNSHKYNCEQCTSMKIKIVIILKIQLQLQFYIYLL